MLQAAGLGVVLASTAFARGAVVTWRVVRGARRLSVHIERASVAELSLGRKEDSIDKKPSSPY
jgi:hypothetical protein